MAGKGQLEAPATGDEYITIDEEEVIESETGDRSPGEFGVGPVEPLLQQFREPKARIPKDWKVRRIPPKNHNGNVKVGDRVNWVNRPRPCYLRGEDKGQPKTAMPYQPTMPAIVNRVRDPGTHEIDLRVLFENDDGTYSMRDINCVKYDAGKREGKKVSYKPGSWH